MFKKNKNKGRTKPYLKLIAVLVLMSGPQPFDISLELSISARLHIIDDQSSEVQFSEMEIPQNNGFKIDQEGPLD